MSKGIYKKLARARGVCSGAGFLLQKLQAQYGNEFGEGMRIQVRQAINQCRQQGAALMAATADNAAQAERMYDKRAKATGPGHIGDDDVFAGDDLMGASS